MSSNNSTDNNKRKKWKTSALIGGGLLVSALILSIVLIEVGTWKSDWIGISADQEKTTIQEHLPPTADGAVTKYTVTIKDVPAKTLWDWMSLLGVPLVLAVLGYWFQDREKKSEAVRQGIEKQNEEDRHKQLQEIAKDNRQDEILKNYFDSMKELLLDKKLKSSEDDEEVRDVARILTLTVFRQLDSGRKGLVTMFLQESELICVKEWRAEQENNEKSKSPIINLSGADLSGADLSRADFSRADFSRVDLSRANISRTFSSRANFSHANLSAADLSGINLSGADLSYANLSAANLSAANLNNANLRGVDLSNGTLRQATLSGANLVSTDLGSANLSGANLSGADLGGARYDDETTLPRNCKPESCGMVKVP